MVHISGGVLSLPVLAAGWAITFILIAAALLWSKRKSNIEEEIPKLSVMTAAFFVASLVRFPVPPTSVHFILNGLVGVTLGILGYPAIFIGVLLQAVLFQHGGISTIGINAVNMGIPALIAGVIFKGGSKLGILSESIESTKRIKAIRIGILGVLIGGLAVVLAVFLTAAIHIVTGKDFFEVAIIVAVILAVISLIAYLLRVPDAVRNRIFCGIFAGLVLVLLIFSIFCVLALIVKGENFFLIAISLAAANIPVILLEAAVIGFDIAYLVRAYSAAKIGIFSAFVVGLAIVLAVVFTAAALIASGEAFFKVAVALIGLHIPIILIEAAVVGSTVAYLVRVKPEMIRNLGGDNR